MGMLNSKPKVGLTRTPNPVVKNTVDRSAQNINKMLERSHNQDMTGVRSRTERATIKIDNHVRNILSTLVNLGVFNSHKDAVEKMAQIEIEKLTPDARKRFDIIFDSLELKDFNKQNK